MYRLATKGDLNEAALLFAEAFADYPFYKLLSDGYKCRGKYIKALTKMNLVFLKTMVKSDAVLLSVENNKIIGLAVFERSDKKQPTIATFLRNGGLSVLLKIRPKRLFDFLKLTDDACAACKRVEEDNWFLAAFCVHKNYHGTGVGSKMFLNGILPFAKENCCKLITFNTNTQKNVDFYEKLNCNNFDKHLLVMRDIVLQNWAFKRYVD